MEINPSSKAPNSCSSSAASPHSGRGAPWHKGAPSPPLLHPSCRVLQLYPPPPTPLKIRFYTGQGTLQHSEDCQTAFSHLSPLLTTSSVFPNCSAAGTTLTRAVSLSQPLQISLRALNSNIFVPGPQGLRDLQLLCAGSPSALPALLSTRARRGLHACTPGPDKGGW